MEAFEHQVRIFRVSNGRSPYIDWIRSLRDRRAEQKIEARIARIRLGNFGQVRNLGGGVLELKIDYGPGYRIYFGQDGTKLVILICGGDKSTQAKDIRLARKYWSEYQKEKRDAND